MALPDNVSTVTVTATFLDFAGNPLAGSVTFQPTPTRLLNASRDVILVSVPLVAELDASGQLSVELLATDDEDLNPSPFRYKVTETISGGASRTYDLAVPADSAGGTIDLADVTPADAVPSSLLPDQIYGRLNVDNTWTGDQAISGRLTVNGFALPTVAPIAPRPSWSTPSRIITLFQSGHGWSTSGGVASSDLNDTSDFVRGTQSAKVVFSGNGNLEIDGISPSIDLTGKAVRFLVKVDDVTKLSQLNIRIGTSASNVFQWQCLATTGISKLFKSGEWTPVVVSWADVHSGAGSFSLDSNREPSATSGFDFIRFQVIATGGNVTVNFQSVEIIDDTSAAFPDGVVSIVFDDTWGSQWDLARPAMDAYGFRGTQYTIAQAVGDADRLTLAQLRDLQDLSGWEIAGHAYSQTVHDNRLTSYTAAEVDDDLRNLRAWLVSNGFSGDSFAYPGGAFENTTDGVPIERLVSRYFSSGRTILSTYGSASNILKESFPPPRPQRLLALSAIGDYPDTGGMDDPENIVADGGILDVTKRQGAWLILTFHRLVASDPADDTECSAAAFESIIDAIDSYGLPVVPVGEVIRS